MKHISTLVELDVHKKLVNEALDKEISLQELQRRIIDQYYSVKDSTCTLSVGKAENQEP
jgi:hypothetical protein